MTVGRSLPANTLVVPEGSETQSGDIIKTCPFVKTHDAAIENICEAESSDPYTPLPLLWKVRRITGFVPSSTRFRSFNTEGAECVVTQRDKIRTGETVLKVRDFSPVLAYSLQLSSWPSPSPIRMYGRSLSKQVTRTLLNI